MELSEQAIGRIATVRDLLREVSEAGAGVGAASPGHTSEHAIGPATTTGQAGWSRTMCAVQPSADPAPS